MKFVVFFLCVTVSALAAQAPIKLNWTDNSNNETGFLIERAVSTTTPVWGQIGTVSANVTTFSDTSWLPSTTYIYRVRAVNVTTNSGGTTTSYSPYSGVSASVLTPVLPPPTLQITAPSGVTPTAPPPVITIVVPPGFTASVAYTQ